MGISAFNEAIVYTYQGERQHGIPTKSKAIMTTSTLSRVVRCHESLLTKEENLNRWQEIDQGDL